jgi:hypothetical protein
MEKSGFLYTEVINLLYIIIQGYSKRSIYFQKFISQVLLNIWRHVIYRLKGELCKLFSHLTSTGREPHV